MTDVIKAMEGRIVEETVDPLYLRPSVILVRPGNPRKIAGIRDLLQPGRTVMVVHGAGQVALWEDIVGRTGDVGAVRAFRRNIAVTAPNSAEATKLWNERPEIDAWIIWNIWNAADRTPTDVVPVEPELRIWRDTGVALTRQGAEKAVARDFVAFLKSPDGKAIFARYGWVDKAG
jgi:accessory colonization factor AcfC